MPDTPTPRQTVLKKELGLRDLVLAQILCVVGSAWVGVAAKLGRAHTVFWLAAMLLFFIPLAAVVHHLNRLMPFEGGLYQWAKAGYGEIGGLLVAWNLMVYALVTVGVIVYVVPTDLSYLIGPSAAWIPASKPAALALTGGLVVLIAAVAARGLDASKHLHNAGSIAILTAYALLIGLPAWALINGAHVHYEPLSFAMPKFDLFSLAIFGQMTVGALSGFEYVAILAGECFHPGRAIGRSVWISAPIIALMFILGTSSVLTFTGSHDVNLIGPIPQTYRLAFARTGAAVWIAQFGICLLMARAVAGSSLTFTGLTRLPMTAGWDHLAPAWFSRLHPRWRTPVNSIVVMTLLVVAFLAASTLGVREQETNQLLEAASTAHYAIAYMALFALPLVGKRELRKQLPGWLKAAACAGFVSSLISLSIAVYPVVDVVSRVAFAAKIAGLVLLSNATGVGLYFAARARSGKGAIRNSSASSLE